MSFRHTPAGERRHVVRVQNPTRTPDGNGGYTEAWTDATPATVYAMIRPATARDLERATAGTVIAQQTHTVAIPYHAGVTEHTRLVAGALTLAVAGVEDPDLQHLELRLACVEVHP